MNGTPLGVALIGAGFIGAYHVEGLAAAGGATLRLVTGRNLERAQRFAAQHGAAEASDDWRRALERRDVQAVIIATPDHTHEAIALAAIAAGKHVLLQKPMASDVAACRRIAEAARAAGVDLQVSFMHRHFEEVVRARELLAEGALGTLHTVRVRNATPGPDWGDWFFDPSHGPGGVVLQLGVHGIDLAAWLLGPIREVSAQLATLQRSRRLKDGRVVEIGTGVPDTGFARYAFAGGVLGTHEMSMIEAQGTDRFRLELYGEAGTLMLRGERGPLALWAPARHGSTWWVPELENAPLGRRQHRAWLDGIAGRAPRADTAAEAIAGMEVVAAIERSARAGGITVPVAA